MGYWGASGWEQVGTVAPARPPLRRRRRMLGFNGRLFGLGVAVLLAVGLLGLGWHRQRAGVSWVADAPDGYTLVGVPPTGDPGASQPLGAPLVAPSAAAGVPPAAPVVGWDPCRPIHYVTNDKVAPAGSEGLVDEAVARISEATGLQFVSDGTTKEVPAVRRDPYQPEHYGERWAPVLIAWRNPNDSASLGRGMRGHASPTAYPEAGQGPQHYVSGSVTLDTTDAAAMLDQGRRDLLLSVIMHELGHIVGLGHSDGLMASEADPQRPAPDVLSETDLAKFAVAGTRPCFPGQP